MTHFPDKSGEAEFSREPYYRYWKKVCKIMFGWTEEETMRWARRWDRVDDGWFFHEEQAYYVADLLIPDELYVSLDPSELRRLQWRLKVIIAGRDDLYYAINFDFEDAKQKVERLLREEYGTTIPRRKPESE